MRLGHVRLRVSPDDSFIHFIGDDRRSPRNIAFYFFLSVIFRAPDFVASAFWVVVFFDDIVFAATFLVAVFAEEPFFNFVTDDEVAGLVFILADLGLLFPVFSEIWAAASRAIGTR